MQAVRLHPEVPQEQHSLIIKRTGTGSREIPVELSTHADRRSALDALYDHLKHMSSLGFTAQRDSLLHWTVTRQDVDCCIQCALYITQTETTI